MQHEFWYCSHVSKTVSGVVMNGITARDLMNRGIGFVAGVNSVLKLFGVEKTLEDEKQRQLLRDYIKAVIANHRQP